MKKLIVLIGIISWASGVGIAYSALFGTAKFGSDVFGIGTTTTSEYTPGYHRTIIIGGGLVKLEKERMVDEGYILFDKLMLMEDSKKWAELLDSF